MPKIIRRDQKPDRSERLGINLADIDRIDPAIRGMLLGGKLDLTPIRIDPDRIDETAVAFSCDLLTAACIVDTLRSHDRRAGDSPTRAYLSRDGGQWQKLAGGVVLTRIVGEKAILDPSVFPIEVRPGDIIAKRPERVEW